VGGAAEKKIFGLRDGECVEGRIHCSGRVVGQE
jgi:hypothetical protein